MHLPSPSHESLVRQFIGAARVPGRQQRAAVRQQFGQKLSQHLNKLQMNQLREDRFTMAQHQKMDKHTDALQRARQFLQLKQQKAHANKSHSLLQRSKKAESDLARWQQVVDRNREKYERELEQAKAVITLWNQKLSDSSARRSSHLQGLTNNLKHKLDAKEKRILTLRLKDEIRINPQHFNSLHSSPKHSANHSTRKHTRISTESFIDRKRQQEEDFLKESIIRTVSKQQRINQARYMRHYLQERKRKQHIDKEELLKAMRDNNLSALRGTHEQRNHIIEKKLAKRSAKEVHPIPKKRASESLKVVFNGFTERDDTERTLDASPNRNYDKLMNQKLRDISFLMRKQRAKGEHKIM